MASIIPGYSYDIFISYRQKDNKYDGWVTEFVDNLKRELDSAFKEEVNVYFDINPLDGLLETHDVDATLKMKLKCLICIPIISRTYCDPKSFAWENEFKAFVDQASADRFGLKVNLPNGNVANRILPVRIHDLDIADIRLFESTMGGVLRSIDFVYKETGVNRQLRAKDDDIIKNPGQVLYRDQINKVALAVKDIIESLRLLEADARGSNSDFHDKGERKEEHAAEKWMHEEKNESEKEVIGAEQPVGNGSIPFLPKRPQLLILFALVFLAITTAIILTVNHRSEVRWAKKDAIADIQQSLNNLNFASAFDLVNKAEKYISDEPKFRKLEVFIRHKVTILTDPPGADVYLREYSDTSMNWRRLGITPIDSMMMPNYSFYLIKLEKQGYEDVLAVLPTVVDTLSRKMLLKDSIPAGMVYVEGFGEGVRKHNFKGKDGFFMDRYEVTNRQFKEFVDKGGYRDMQYWGNDFIKDGKILSREKAMSEFIDKSGRPGPATWEAGDYPDGQGDYPVNGISWYEAAAYARYAGKDLPTSDHWDTGAGFYYEPAFDNFGSRIFRASNFRGKGPDPVGKNKGMNCFGAFDMAGNVREWCWNETESGHIIRGGGWDDPDYMYGNWSQVPSFDRSSKNGLRCVRYPDKGRIPESAFQKVEYEGPRDYSKEKPVPENIFMIYKNQFLYDNKPLDAKIETTDESPQDWKTERITFNAAYGNERVISYLFLPKNQPPPYQTIIFFPGSYSRTDKDLINNVFANWFTDYFLKSGRAVMYPIYKGTYERIDEPIVWDGHQYTEWLIRWVRDFSRSVDYLETRKDIDTAKLAFYGHSWGGIMGGFIPAVEDRLALSILITGGFSSGNSGNYPEADAINYVPWIKMPVLMLNGKYDMTFPYETTVKPFFNLLGTPEKDKRLVLYETDHGVPKSEMIKETLNWLDRYFGPVK
jgi:hypothetical protein